MKIGSENEGEIERRRERRREGGEREGGEFVDLYTRADRPSELHCERIPNCVRIRGDANIRDVSRTRITDSFGNF